MSIYPVKINKWYYNKRNPFSSEKEAIEKMLPSLKCNVCSKKATKRGYVMHSITFYCEKDYWCSKKCLNKEYKNGI